MRGVYVVQGAARGLGLGLARHALEAGARKVFATCRRPKNAAALTALQDEFGCKRLSVIGMDITNEGSIGDCVRSVSAHLERGCRQPVDRVFVCAGMLHDDGKQPNGDEQHSSTRMVGRPERRAAEVRPEWMARSFAVNAIGPLMTASAFAPLLRKGSGQAAVISARVGSISDNKLGGWYSYRMSKAALHQGVRCLAIELGRGRNPVTVVALHPGTVDTDLSAPFQANVPAEKLFSVDYSVGCMWDVLDGLDEGASGKVFAWDGQEIPP